MGTRADFYVRDLNEKMEWLGSIAFDGYSIDKVEGAKSEESFRTLLDEFLKGRDDATFPNEGWPWPWTNSKLTDEAWVWNASDNKLYRATGYEGDHNQVDTPLMFIPSDIEGYDEEGDPINGDKQVAFMIPDMKAIRNVQFGKQSGLIIVTGKI